MANMEQLDRVVGFITDNPDKHDQGRWIQHHFDSDGVRHEPDPANEWCWTTGCVAGWTVVLNERKLHWYTVYGGGIEAADLVEIDAEHQRAVSDVAQEILEITDNQANWLFSENRTITEIQRFVDKVRDNPTLNCFLAALNDDDDDDYDDDEHMIVEDIDDEFTPF